MEGYCHIFSDRIEIAEEGWLGKLHQWMFNKGMGRKSAAYILLALGALLAVGISLWIDNIFLSSFFSITFLLLLWRAWADRSVSYNPIIPRKELIKVEYIPALQGERRAMVKFQWKKEGKIRKRVVKLPIDKDRATMIAQSTYRMLKDEGLVE